MKNGLSWTEPLLYISNNYLFVCLTFVMMGTETRASWIWCKFSTTELQPQHILHGRTLKFVLETSSLIFLHIKSCFTFQPKKGLVVTYPEHVTWVVQIFSSVPCNAYTRARRTPKTTCVYSPRFTNIHAKKFLDQISITYQNKSGYQWGGACQGHVELRC